MIFLGPSSKNFSPPASALPSMCEYFKLSPFNQQSLVPWIRLHFTFALQPRIQMSSNLVSANDIDIVALPIFRIKLFLYVVKTSIASFVQMPFLPFPQTQFPKLFWHVVEISLIAWVELDKVGLRLSCQAIFDQITIFLTTFVLMKPEKKLLRDKS